MIVSKLTQFKNAFSLLAAALLTIVCAWLAPATLAQIEAQVDDYVWRLVGNNAELEQRIVVLDIDEKSVSRYGQWPWSRQRVSELAAKATKSGASMLIFDMVFPTKKEGDTALASTMAQRPTTLAQILAINADGATQVGQLTAGSADKACESVYPVANAVIANNQVLVNAVTSAGHITPNIDADGVVRDMPSIICYKGRSYPALALAALANGYAEPPVFKQVKNTPWWASSHSLQHQNSALALTVPVNEQGLIRLPWWLSKRSIVSVSAADLITGNVPNNILQGKWVIIGSTAFGAGDSIATPQAGIADGLEVHVQLISALLDNKIPFVPRIAHVFTLLMLLLMAALLYASSRVKGLKVVYMPPLMGVLLSVSALGVHALALSSSAMLLPWVYGVIFATTSSVLMALLGYAASRQESDQLYSNLSSYLPSHAAKWIAFQQPVDVLEAKHEQVLVLHADLRNFSAWCNRLPAQQAGAILHAFYTLTGDIVQKMGGDIEEYRGDAITAVWRASEADKRALIAAQEIIARSEELLSYETKKDQVPPLAIGIGIEYGDVLAGAFGPSQRRTYTVIGKAVSTAMQLQALTADIAVPILIGEIAANQWLQDSQPEGDNLESLGDFLLKDMQQPINVFTVPQTAADA